MTQADNILNLLPLKMKNREINIKTICGFLHFFCQSFIGIKFKIKYIYTSLKQGCKIRKTKD